MTTTRLLMLLACAFALIGSTPVAAVAADPAPPTKPNIIVFLLDDTNPMDGRLWNDPTLTPTLYDTFVAHGVNFTNAIDDTPLCCPSRATLLTGLHSYNHGVTVNDVRLFNPSESIATELDKQNYQTMLIGKYMNHASYLTPAQFQTHAAPWSVFNIFTSPFSDDEGFFYNYKVTQKDGTSFYPTEHSTQWVTENAISSMQATDPTKPIFAELSIVDTHKPAKPMPMFENDTRCDSMPPWDPPNYNEADVSDKPAYVRKTHLLPNNSGWPMVTYCREMLGVDWMVQQVKSELQAENRLDNTMFVFMGDNGMAWGQHRLQLKETPYAVRLPMFFSWPSRWGSAPRMIDEYMSNIDLAPTFCDVAGCTLGPFPTGQSHPDGVSLLPLLDGTVPNLGKQAIIETEWRIHPWAAVQTTQLNPLGLWHYVEYQSGFKELYNVAPGQDPWELTNLAMDHSYDSLMAQLHDELVALLAEGRPAGNATITIQEDSNPNAPQDFSFSGDLGMFKLDDDTNATLPRKKVFSVPAGTYNISQALAPTWNLASITCPVPSTVDLPNGNVALTVFSDSAVTCTFKNERARPDLSIAQVNTGPYKGVGEFSTHAVAGQTQTRNGVAANAEYDYFVNLKNDNQASDSFTLQAAVTSAAQMSATIWAGSTDVTSQVVAGTYTTSSVAPGATMSLVIKVNVGPFALSGDKNVFVLTATSVAKPASVDVVRATTIR